MPVPLERHDPDLGLRPGTTKSDIVAFLYLNDDFGHSPQDIHAELEIPHNTAKVTLKRLYDEEFLDKTPDGYYHARHDREDLYRYTAALEGLDRMFATYNQPEGADDAVEATETAIEESADPTADDIEETVGLVESDPEDEA